MKQIKNIQDMQGLVIDEVAMMDSEFLLLIKFTDDSFAAFTPSNSFGDLQIEIDLGLDISEKVLYKIASDEEIAEYENSKKIGAELQANYERDAELATLARLKIKYEAT